MHSVTLRWALELFLLLWRRPAVIILEGAGGAQVSSHPGHFDCWCNVSWRLLSQDGLAN